MHLQLFCSWFWLRRLALGCQRTPLFINALQVWISCCNKSIIACEYGNSSIWNNVHLAIVRVTKCWTFLSSYTDKMSITYIAASYLILWQYLCINIIPLGRNAHAYLHSQKKQFSYVLCSHVVSTYKQNIQIKNLSIYMSRLAIHFQECN